MIVRRLPRPCLFLFLFGLLATLPNEIVAQPFVAQQYPSVIQVIDPRGLVADPVLFGSGLSLQPSGENLLTIGFDRSTKRQFVNVFTAQTTGQGAYGPGEVILGDLVNSSTLFPAGDFTIPNSLKTSYFVPSCISQDSQWLAFGYRTNGYYSQGSVLIAQKIQSGNTQHYKIQARLFSEYPPGQSMFPYDMVCTSNFGQILISETSFSNATSPFVRLNVYSITSNLAWTIVRTEDYINGTDVSAAPLALLEPEETIYALRAGDPNLVYIRNLGDGSLVNQVNVSQLGMTGVRNLALTSQGNRLIVADSQCQNSSGCVFIIDYNSQLGAFNVSNAFSFATTLLPNSQNEYGFSLAVSRNNTFPDQPGLVIGAPGYFNSFGAALGWKRLLNPFNGQYNWTSNSNLILPTGPNLPSNVRFSGMLLTHSSISNDDLTLVLGGPSLGYNSSGLIFVITTPLPQAVNGPPNQVPTTPSTPAAPTNTGLFLVGLIFAIIVGILLVGVVGWRIYLAFCAPVKILHAKNVYN